MTDLSEETSIKLDMSLDDLIGVENSQSSSTFPSTPLNPPSSKPEGNSQRKKRKNSGHGSRDGPASKMAATTRRPSAPSSLMAFPPPPPSSSLPLPPLAMRPPPLRTPLKYPDASLSANGPPLPPTNPSLSVGIVRTPSGPTRAGVFSAPPQRFPPFYTEDPSSGVPAGAMQHPAGPLFLVRRMNGEPLRRPLHPSAYPGNPPPYHMMGRPRFPLATPPYGDRVYHEESHTAVIPHASSIPPPALSKAGAGIRGMPPPCWNENQRPPLPPPVAPSPHGSKGGRPTLLVGGGGSKNDRGLSLQPHFRGLALPVQESPYGFSPPPPQRATLLAPPHSSAPVTETNGFRMKGESTRNGSQSPRLMSLPLKTMTRNAFEERHSLSRQPRRAIAVSEDFGRGSSHLSAGQSGWITAESPVIKRTLPNLEDEKKALNAVKRETCLPPPSPYGGTTTASISLPSSGNSNASGYSPSYRFISSVNNGSGGLFPSSVPSPAPALGKDNASASSHWTARPLGPGPISFHGRPPPTETQHLSPSTAADSTLGHRRGKYHSLEASTNPREGSDLPSEISSRRTGGGEPPSQGGHKLLGYNVIVTNVPRNLTAVEIQEAFCCLGEVIRTDIMLTSHGEHTGRVSVMYATREAAGESVCRFDGGDLNGSTIRVFME